MAVGGHRIRDAVQLNVDLLDSDGRATHTLCFGPRGSLPVGDTMLAQKCALELYEEDAVAVANWSDGSVVPIRYAPRTLL